MSREPTLGDVLRRHARVRPDARAFADGDLTLSWTDAARRVRRSANTFAALGVGRGDRVLWLGQNSFRVHELLLACADLGAALCPVNWRQQAEELAFVIDDLEPALVVWQRAEIGETVLAGRARARHDTTWLCHDGPDDESDDGTVGDSAYERICRRAPVDEVDGRADDGDAPVLFVYTAAFDGRPNAAMLSSRALVAQGELMAPWMDVDATSVFMNSGPLFHIGTFMFNLATFVAGGANVFIRRSEGIDLCRAIEQHRCTHGFVVGPMVDAIVAANADGRFDLSSFRGRRGRREFDAWVEPDRSRWGRHPGGYGQTEVTGMATFNLLAPHGMGAHGLPSPLVELRVVAPDGSDVPVGETGEIAIRGATVMNGYWNRPALEATRSRDGRHHTNDLGRFETDGSFTFVGPKTRMLKSGAENIYPVEVENCVKSHPAVADCAVIGVPDDRWVQAIKAVVVTVEGTAVTADELIEHCRQHMASYKKPRFVEFVDALPCQGSAVDYDALDARFGGGAYPGGRTRSV